ncbi:MAG: fasciclin domain-containing protein [Bacteroidaceae bacterium]
MKKLITYVTRYVLLSTITLGCFTGCSDHVDDSNLYSFTGILMTDYFATNKDFSLFHEMLTKVTLNGKKSSTLSGLLSARGNYTCFAPNNKAIQSYVDSVYEQKDYPISEVSDSIMEYIARSCIIDNDDTKAYKTTSFIEGSLERTTLNDRYLTIQFDTIAGGEGAIYVNTKSRILQPDIEVENGVIHTVNRILSPSTSSLPAIISEANNLRIFAHLLEVTEWDRKMMRYRDADYEENHPEKGPGLDTQGGGLIDCPAHRNYGYTAFVETDDVLCRAWGITLDISNGRVRNWDEVMKKINVVCRSYYPTATSEDHKSEQNAVNQFIAYHLVDRAIPFNKLVIHYCEIGMAYTRPEILGINAWEYYETMGKQRRILKITEGATTEGKRINRYVEKYNLTNYTEEHVPRPGLFINEKNGHNDFNALNGYYYTLNEPLVYDEEVPNTVLNERMRYDVVALMPELTTNGIRRMSVNKDINVPRGYSCNLSCSNETNICYLSGYGESTWKVYQGDELNVVGKYDMTLRLPPVPYEGSYELRIGISINPRRGMAQLYMGDNPNNLPSIGLPVDLRLEANNPTIGWELDTEDEGRNNEIDKTLRIHGYMKAPEYFGYCNSMGTTQSFRNVGPRIASVRKIIWTGTMHPEKVYYLRFKSVLQSTNTQLSTDYIEIVPKSVYNGKELEDRW